MQKHKFIIVITLIAVAFAACGIVNKKVSLGTLEATKKTFSAVHIYFENNNPKAGLLVIDSIFATLKQPTLYDYDIYYNGHCFYASLSKLYYQQINFADTLINIVKENSSEKETSTILVNAYLNKAAGYYNLQNIEQANQTYFRAFAVAEQFGNNTSKSNLAYDIAMKMYQQKQYDTAINYFKYAYKYNLSNTEIPLPHKNNKTQELLDNIGLCYTYLNKNDSALAYYRNCIKFLNIDTNNLAVDSNNSRIRKKTALGVVHGNLAKVYNNLGNTDSAIILYKKAIGYNNFLEGDIHDMQTCVIQLSNIYIRTKKIPELKELIEFLKQTCNNTTTLATKLAAENMAYNYFLLTNKPVFALQKLQAYNSLKDSLAKTEATRIQQDITKELKDREQQLQISLLKKSNEVSTLYNWAFGIFLIVATVVSVLVFLVYKKEKKNLYKQAILNKEITEQKKEIEIVVDELAKSNMQKDKLMNIMAHELRSPISGITAVASTLKESTYLNTHDAELVAMIEQTSFSTLSLINQLLEEKNQSTIVLKKSATNINNLLQQVIALLQYKANEKQQSIIFQELTEQLVINIDAEKIERVLINLLTNAIKFSDIKKSIWVSVKAEANTIKLIIKDEGIGMSANQLSQLFSNEATIKRSGTMGEKSFGLGLPICKQIVESHSGKIVVSSIEQVGTTFIVELPV
jgi:two-component system, OmpR family, sensor histidine kinase VicK